jgi:hypothetical protein
VPGSAFQQVCQQVLPSFIIISSSSCSSSILHAAIWP